MNERVDAIYDHGVLRPLAPLNLPEMARVRVTIDAESASAAVEVVAKDGHGGDFESELDALLFSGPTLPSDFSRADIYADHD
jgi:predicted DNA-binding antitoxin AbrB/MazE fold protein